MRYAGPANPGTADDDARAVARGEGVMTFATVEVADSWLGLIPSLQLHDLAQPGTPSTKGLGYEDAAIMTLHFVQLDVSAEDLVFGRYQVSDTAWSRWLAAAKELLGGGDVGTGLGEFVFKVLAALPKAPKRLREALMLRATDCVRVEGAAAEWDAAFWALPLSALADPTTRMCGPMAVLEWGNGGKRGTQALRATG